MKGKILFGTDCSGIGAPEQALKELGVDHTVIFACERDKYARQTYLANHSCETMYEDITTRDNSSIEQLDLYIAGYPCQAFSNSGKKGGEDDARGTIFYSGFDFIKKNRPKIFILENVPGMLNVKGVNILDKWLDLLACTVNGQRKMFGNPDSLGYHCYWAILNTKHFGIPQNRERVFIVGFREEVSGFNFPTGEPLKKKLRDILETEVDKKYYLSETALARIARRNDFAAQINPDVTGTINTKNNSGQLSVDHGTNLIVVSNQGNLEQRDEFQCVDAKYHKGMDNHCQRSFVVQEATKKGFDIATEGDSINLSNPESETRRVRVGKQIANTLDTACNQAVVEPTILQRERGYNEGGVKDICPTITKNSFEHNNHVVEPIIVASRGRNPENPTSRESGLPTEQQLEPNREGIVNTLTSVQKDNLLLWNSNIRRLTPRECARLQGFPDTFQFPVSETQAYKQCGNSMSVPVIKAVIKNAIVHLRNYSNG